MSSTALFVFGIEPIRIGGMELQTRRAAEQLAARGWKCVLCFHNIPEEPVRSYLSLENVILDELPEAWQFSRRTALGLRRLLGKYHPQILHLQFTPSLSLFPWLGRLYGAERIFYTDHGSRPEGFVPRRAPLWKRLAGGILNAPLTKVIGVSEYNRRTTIARGYMDPSRVTRIYNGTDMTLHCRSGTGATFRERYGIAPNSTLVVQVCWMIPEKGVADLLEAARTALLSNGNLHFALVGEGPQRALFTERAREMGIGDKVTWTGLIQDPHDAGVYAAADIACQFSRWEEAFGMVINEAMIYSKPLVATRVGGIPELVRDGETGFLVARGDTAAMAARILELAADPELRQRMGSAGRRLAEAEFDVCKTSAQLMNLYGFE